MCPVKDSTIELKVRGHSREACQTVFGQVGKLRKMFAGKWEIQIFGQFQVLDKWQKVFPICPMSTSGSMKSMQYMDKWEHHFTICPNYLQSLDKRKTS